MAISKFKSTLLNIVIVAGSALLITGCAYVVDGKGSKPKRIISEAIKELEDKFIKPVQADKMVMAGLSHLSTVDENIHVRSQYNSIVLSHAGINIIEREMPNSADGNAWAELSANFLSVAQRVSRPLASYTQDDLLRVMFQGLVQKNLDKYSRYETPEEAHRSRASREGFGGIGIQLVRINGDFVIRQSLPNRPATGAGLRTNDRITHINGYTIRGSKLIDVVKQLRGRVGDTVAVTILRPGDKKSFNRKIIRDYIVPSTVMVTRDGNILLARVTSFNVGTVGTLRRQLVKTARQIGMNLKGIILDLRSNPGGLLDQAVAVSDLFLTEGRIISINGRHPESLQRFDASSGEVLPGVPMVVIVNGRSASAAEIVTVALRDAGRAAVIGSTSYGKGTVQTIIPLPNKGGFNVTWARIFAPSGQSIESQGIVPAICTNVSNDQITEIFDALATKFNYQQVNRDSLQAKSYQPHFSLKRQASCQRTGIQSPNDMRAARLLLKNKLSYAAATGRLIPNLVGNGQNSRLVH